MKNTLLLLLCAFALATATSGDVYPNGCPKDHDIEQLFPHNNCHKFYQCWDGKLVVHTCPSKLYFSVEENRCEWAIEVDCSGREVPEDNNDSDENDNEDKGNEGSTCNCNPEEAPAICAAKDSNGELVAHENCNQFYICNEGAPVTISCPGNLLFNPYENKCDWPDKVQCDNRVIPDGEDCDDNGNEGGDNGGEGNGDNDNGDGGNGGGTCNCNPEEAPAICQAEDSNDVLVAHENCNQFYVCSQGAPVALSCPGNLLFNPYKNQCDWPDKVECGDRVIPDGEDCDDNSNEGGDNGGGDNGGNGGGDNGGNGGGDNGGEGDGDNDNGDGGNGGGTCNCNPEEAPAICQAEDSNDVLVAHENCNQFYVCSQGAPVALSCPGNLLFNPYKNQCDWPDKVECGNRVIPDGEDCDDNGNEGGGNGGGDNGGNGGGDNGGEGNGDNDNGDGGNGGGTCNCKPEEAPAICQAEDSNDVLVAHENCNQFYVCSQGAPVALSCPGNLLFNPYKNQCDWPDKVECGDRVIPDGEDCDDNSNEGGDNGGGDNGGNGDGDNGGNGGGDNEGEGDGDNDNGDGGNGGGTCNCNPEEAPAICQAEDSNDVLVAHENCNQFYICSQGAPVALSCPGNLLFNPYKNQCDWPDKVECGDRVIPDGEDCDDNSNEGGDNGGGDNGGNEGGDNGGNGGGDNGGEGDGDNDNGDGGNGGGTCNCNPEEAPAICQAEDSNDVLVAHENCNQFYICSQGAPVALSCPGNLLFNPYKNQCDWPDKVECGDRVIPDGEDCDDNSNEGGDNGGGDNGGNGGGDNGGNGGGDNEGEGDGDNDNGDGGNGGGTCNCNPEEAPAICAAEDSNGELVAHENCNQFYICSAGVPVVLSCPANLLFNPYKNICDWPDKVECGNRVIPDGEDCDDNDNEGDDNGGNGSGDNGGNGGGDNGGEGNGDGGNGGGTCNCNPEEAPAICAAEDSNGELVAHENCNQFYICSAGAPVVLSCPGNLLFNPYKNICDWPDKVECGNRVIPDGEDCDDNDNEGDDNGGNGSGDNGGNGGGDNGGEGNGDGGNGGGTCNCNPEEAPAICAAEDSNGELVAHENCNQFYICSAGAPVVLSCPGNLLFNPYKNICDWPDKVECGNRVIPDGEDCDDNDNEGDDNGGNGSGDNGGNGGGDNGGEGNGDGGNGGGTCNCNPEEAPAICAAEDSNGELVAHENCNQFYICSAGAPVVLSCPGNLLFNPYKNICDWPDKVECGNRVIPDGEDCDDNDNEGDDNGGNGSGDNGGNGGGDNGGEGNGDGGNGGGTCNCNPEEAPAICAAEDSNGELVAHENCNQFYICSAGAPVVLSCPGNLLFNPYKNICDWPDKVECGNRVIPDGEDCDGNDNEGDDNGGNGSGDNGGNGGGDNGGEDNGDGGNGGGTCNCNPEDAPAICAAEDSNGVLIAHENCNQFYICSGGAPVTLSCPGDLLFNPYTNKCDWADNVKCIRNDNDDTKEEEVKELSCLEASGGAGNDDPRLASAICSSDNSEGVLIAHENCNQFYICNHNEPVAMSCPASLLFNPHNDKCDWSHCVECGRRINNRTFSSLNKHLSARQVLRVL
ncbi:unnamed protein product [Diatraea saccharalis]|uniref:Chitin-binding type-2 domain-containing protein n=1 Tax=Diatraea saccharalis TaxID=40085 RepID=A0A9N9R7C2_9NEOP|nr:unnamed protein product [Diatraea saccharalis]